MDKEFKLEIGQDDVFRSHLKSELIWLPEIGMGYFPTPDDPADAPDYFPIYEKYGDSEMGHALTKKRVQFVDEFHEGAVIDIGIGCGQFIEARPNTKGCDVNEKGIAWLNERGLFMDPTVGKMQAATFWDSLEHIKNPDAILNNITKWAFVSLPIFENADHILRSKHFKKDEHCWYWTREGFISWMYKKGFDLVTDETFESDMGREDIQTFCFKRNQG